jgi:hypothetical protein
VCSMMKSLRIALCIMMLASAGLHKAKHQAPAPAKAPAGMPDGYDLGFQDRPRGYFDAYCQKGRGAYSTTAATLVHSRVSELRHPVVGDVDTQYTEFENTMRRDMCALPPTCWRDITSDTIRRSGLRPVTQGWP